MPDCMFPVPYFDRLLLFDIKTFPKQLKLQ